MQLVILVVMLALTWVLFVRPQQQRLKRQRELVAKLAVGDQVVTAGGMIGTVTAVRTGEIEVELAPGTRVRMLPGAITRPWDGTTDAGADAELDDVQRDDDGVVRGPGDALGAPRDPDERGPAA